MSARESIYVRSIDYLCALVRHFVLLGDYVWQMGNNPALKGMDGEGLVGAEVSFLISHFTKK